MEPVFVIIGILFVLMIVIIVLLGAEMGSHVKRIEDEYETMAIIAKDLEDALDISQLQIIKNELDKYVYSSNIPNRMRCNRLISEVEARIRNLETIQRLLDEEKAFKGEQK
jgi:hypothetical protein